ncbi:glycosyltransferase family 4 protein [Hydrogenimonas urashimensis]|uniref:glycosyltransferase family 4 protein n=1 Tax=Hydrogenimonas urashimensis TaxID=2740515 RepID=UPI0019165AB9|nr:glycosyltransferase [Hydrogenimonas urashimensis]
MKKPKLLCILHRSPPAHGAAKVGDFIASSIKLKEVYDCRFVTIRSSDTIGDIGKVSFKKIYLLTELYAKVLWALVTFRPDKIYYTASVQGVAFYRDLLISTLWKAYRTFKDGEVFYHYHTKGVDEFVSASRRNLILTRFFVKDVNLILLSPWLEKDFEKVKTYKKVLYLPNGVEDPMANENFEAYIDKKYSNIKTINVLYLAHMMKEKGYWEVLELANKTKDFDIHYDFAGSWQSIEDEKGFFNFLETRNLKKRVTYHGYVSGKKKHNLFKKAHLLMYPSKNDAFPLTLIESLSYGIPAIATDEGSIPFILNEKCGIVLNKNNMDLYEALQKGKEKFLNKKTAQYCRKRYSKYFTLEQFEKNLVKIFDDDMKEKIY